MYWELLYQVKSLNAPRALNNFQLHNHAKQTILEDDTFSIDSFGYKFKSVMG